MSCLDGAYEVRGRAVALQPLSKLCLTSSAAFGKAVQCLAKIGEDLHIEALKEGVELHSILCTNVNGNTTRTTHICTLLAIYTGPTFSSKLYNIYFLIRN